MPGVTYGTPPQYPELNLTSPFATAGTLIDYICVTNNQLPRGLNKNWAPRPVAGVGGLSTGTTPQIIPNAFPMNAPADGLYANDYALRGGMNCRALWYPYSAGIPSGGNSLGTIAAVFKFEDIHGPNTNGSGNWSACPIATILYGALFRNMIGAGANPTHFSPYLRTNAMFGVVSNGAGIFQGYSNSNIGNPINYGYVATNVIVPGHWYAAAWACSDFNGTVGGGANLNHVIRMYLHDLTTNTRISNTVSGGVKQDQSVVHQSFGTQTNATISNYVFGWDSAWNNHTDLMLFPGASFGKSWPAVQVKCVLVDNYLWDDTGFWTPIPAAYSGTPPFDAFVANIYSLAGSTYATGTTTGNLYNPTSAQKSSVQVTFDVTEPLYTGATGVNGLAVAPGVTSGALVVANGDCSVTKVDNTTVRFKVTRPQAAPNAPSPSWLWKLFASTDSTKGATGTAALTYTGQQPDFAWNPPSSGVPYFVNITANDGTNTYTYQQLTCSLNPLADIYLAVGGNSIFTGTGKDPIGMMGVLMNGYGANCTVLNYAVNGTTSPNWQPTAATSAAQTPSWYPAASNYYGVLAAKIQAEFAYLPAGAQFDVFFQLLTNDEATFVASGYTAIATAALALTAADITGTTRNCVKRVFFCATTWCVVHGLASNAAGLSTMLTAQEALENGTTIFSLGRQAAMWTANLPFDLDGQHPNQTTMLIEATQFAGQYLDVIHPTPTPTPTGTSRRWFPGLSRPIRALRAG